MTYIITAIIVLAFIEGFAWGHMSRDKTIEKLKDYYEAQIMIYKK